MIHTKIVYEYLVIRREKKVRMPEAEVRFTDSWLYTPEPELTEWVKKNRDFWFRSSSLSYGTRKQPLAGAKKIFAKFARDWSES